MLRRFLIAVFLILAATSAAAYALKPDPVSPVTEAATLKVVRGNGHGSAIHIGEGFVVTAAHVVGDEKSVTVKLKDGQTRQADVLWANKTYDVALLRMSSAGIGSASLDCRVASVGENITSIGNPLSLEFVSAFGRIAGSPRETGPWKSVLVTDITTIMGQSGGAVFDTNGNVVGITVGVMSAQVGFTASVVGFGYVVPSSVICGLLGRA